MNPLDRWTSPQTIIALVLLTILAGTVAAVFWFHDPQTISQTVGGILGVAGMVSGYYFGSSSGSQRKDDTIHKLAETNQ